MPEVDIHIKILLIKSLKNLKQGPDNLAPHISESIYQVITYQCIMLNADLTSDNKIAAGISESFTLHPQLHHVSIPLWH